MIKNKAGLTEFASVPTTARFSYFTVVVHTYTRAMVDFKSLVTGTSTEFLEHCPTTEEPTKARSSRCI